MLSVVGAASEHVVPGRIVTASRELIMARRMRTSARLFPPGQRGHGLNPARWARGPGRDTGTASRTGPTAAWTTAQEVRRCVRHGMRRPASSQRSAWLMTIWPETMIVRSSGEQLWRTVARTGCPDPTSTRILMDGFGSLSTLDTPILACDDAGPLGCADAANSPS